MAIQSCVNMVSRFAGGGIPIMTGLAIIHDTGVIKHRAGKSTRRMTDTTILVSRNMTD